MEILFWGLGAIGFWITLGIVSIVLFALVEGERPGWATFTILGTLAFLQFGTSLKPLTLAADHRLMAALCVLGYFAAGTFWMIGKWWFYTRAQRRRYDDHKQAFLEHHGIEGTAVPQRLKGSWCQQLGYEFHFDANGAIAWPKAKENKSRLMLWAVYWPWSMIWTVIDDPIKRVFNAIYQSLRTTLDNISKRAFAGVDEDFDPPEQTPPNQAPPDQDPPDEREAHEDPIAPPEANQYIPERAVSNTLTGRSAK